MTNFIRISALLLILITTQSVYAQSIVLKGKVFEEDRPKGEGIPGATLQIKNTNRGVITDIDGSYSLICNMNDTLLVRFLGFETITWVVSQPAKDFFMEVDRNTHISYSYFAVLDKHSFSVLSTFTPHNDNLGMSVNYRYSLSKFETSRVNDDYLRPMDSSMLGFSANYARTDLQNSGLFYPQIDCKIPIPLQIRNKYPFFISLGTGYYWHLNDSYQCRKGNIMFSTQLQFARKHFFKKKVTLEFVGGYNVFMKSKESNHFHFGVVVYPCKSWI